MLPVINAFKAAHGLTDVTVVADAGMISEANQKAIQAAGLSFILGTRMPGALAAQYVALFGAMAFGSWQIARGQAIEPAAFVSKIASMIGDRLAKASAS